MCYKFSFQNTITNLIPNILILQNLRALISIMKLFEMKSVLLDQI